MANPAGQGMLAGQVALVTGASSGLGRRFAAILADAGATVAVAARRRDRLDALVDEIAASGARARATPFDAADAASFGGLLDRIEADLGTVSILVNNAGIADGATSMDVGLDAIDRLMAVNIKAPFVLAREVAKRLIAARRPGRIVNISAISAFHFGPAQAAAFYACTKAAVLRMTEILAVEMAEYGINVNAIAPGFFASEMSEAYLAEAGNGVIQALRRRRIGQPGDLDTTLRYLVDPASGLVTGTLIKVDDAQFPR